MAWTDPSDAGSLDVANGALVTKTIWDYIRNNLLALGGAAWPASVTALGNRNAAGQFIQHGTANIVVSNTVSGQATVTFPVAFTTLLTIVACLKTVAGAWSVNFDSESTTGVTFYIEEVGGINRSGTMVLHWMAIGT